jgi:hypothetical protein
MFNDKAVRQLNEAALAKAKKPPTPIISDEVLKSLGGDELQGEQYRRPELASFVENDHAMGQLKQVHDFMREKFPAFIAAARSNDDPSMTPEAYYLELKKRADPLLERVGNIATDARGAAERQIEAYENDIAARMKVSESEHAKDIREYVSKLKPEERIAFMQQAVDDGDTETLGAVFSGRAYLSGFEPGEAGEKQRAVFVNLYRQKVAPDLVAKQDALRFAVEINSTAVDQFIAAYTAIFPHERVEEITKQANAAKAKKDAVWSF